MELSTKERVPNILCYKYAVSVVRKGILKKVSIMNYRCLVLKCWRKIFNNYPQFIPNKLWYMTKGWYVKDSKNDYFVVSLNIYFYIWCCFSNKYLLLHLDRYLCELKFLFHNYSKCNEWISDTNWCTCIVDIQSLSRLIMMYWLGVEQWHIMSLFWYYPWFELLSDCAGFLSAGSTVDVSSPR